MSDVLLVLNAGSSSLKFSAFRIGGADGLALAFEGQVEGIGVAPRVVVHGPGDEPSTERRLDPARVRDHAAAIATIEGVIGERLAGATAVGVGHRIVHGGPRYDRPVRIDATVMSELEALVPLAPLHQPHNLAGIRAVASHRPGLPQVACFDTAFHRTQPEVAQAFALPRDLDHTLLRRYGFHGLSYEYVTSLLPSIAPGAQGARVVIAHLGNGASLCAVRDGRSVATTMGLTALDGLVMGTRCGAIDPGVLLYLMDEHGMDARALEDLLYHRSGLLGVSGLSSDMRALLASEDANAREAVDLFVYRIARELGSMAAALGGLDALIFTGGIGENAAPVRARVCRDAAWLGVALDDAANARGGPRISVQGSRVAAFVVATDENLMIARHTASVLGVRT